MHWTQLWRININPNKTQAKIFTLCRPSKRPPLIINKTTFPWLDTTVKYLGVYLDQRLTWKSHIQMTIDKTS